MATAEQLKALIRSHFDDDREQFSTVALQLAAHEARQGHPALAHDIRTIVERSKRRRFKVIPFHRDLDDLVLASEPKARMSELVVPVQTRGRIARILREFRQREKLRKHGLENRRRLLLTGPPGTGKTLTATVIAGELTLPLFTVLMDKLVTKFMGETAAKLRQIFAGIEERKGVYLFDEFDAIGGERSRDDDVGEMRRVLNAFLHFIERDRSDGLIIAATNNPDILDQALFRRFDDVLRYHLPSLVEVKQLIENRLGAFRSGRFSLESAAKRALSLSHSEICQACDDSIKASILDNKAKVTNRLFSHMLQERRVVYEKTMRK